jgi:hypothetical protein
MAKIRLQDAEIQNDNIKNRGVQNVPHLAYDGCSLVWPMVCFCGVNILCNMLSYATKFNM